MGRLIDADAFKKFIKEKYKDGESTDDIKDQILFDLSYQPTAYDPEKVVIELDKSSFLMEPRTEGHYADNGVFLDEAIKIVRKGGAE